MKETAKQPKITVPKVSKIITPAESRAWFKQAKYGMMIHFGLYSILGGEYRYRRMDVISEWAQSYFRIPNNEYHKLAEIFNPIYFDAEQWVWLAKEAGMEYMVVTSKHHEGFALFKSEVSKFNVVDATPFKRDIIGELAEACYKHGLKFGVYYSQDLDWSDPNGGGWICPEYNCGFMSWTNDWDFPNNNEKDYSICFENKIKPQVKELLTNYGDLCLIWFDTPRTINKEQSTELYNMVKHYQPNCLVNSRIGNGLGDYKSAGDNFIPADDMGDILYETPATLNDSWGYKPADQNWKDPEKVYKIKTHLNERGINYLLNVGPDHLGRIPGAASDILREVGLKIKNPIKD